MVNFRVADLDAMLTQLRSAGVDVIDAVEESEYGRFGWPVRDLGTSARPLSADAGRERGVRARRARSSLRSSRPQSQTI